ncbi:bifunctional DNA primase/polymerase [Amycolatopsis sp. NPDC001319]|uniref:bifunctional DNA primase/polymerase n=1 Tax=unclassified Amycolatopsis TaxID=2618356 RepID=UPI00368054A7
MAERLVVSLRRWALEFAGRGWPVYPLRPGAKRPDWHRKDRCPQAGRCADGHVTPEQMASTDPGLIERAWAATPWNIALFPGPAGLLAIDCDQPKPGHTGGGDPDGWTQLQRLAAERGGPLPDTFTVTTPTGGRHLLYTVPPGCVLRSTVKHIASNVDTRGWGGYLVGAGSLRPDGAYELLDDTTPVQLPGWLVQANVEHASTAISEPGEKAVAAPSAYAAKALQAETDRVRSEAPGRRNKVLSTAAFALGQLVGAGLLDEHHARTELQTAVAAWGDTASLGKDHGVIDTSLRAGAANPRRVKPRGHRAA